MKILFFLFLFVTSAYGTTPTIGIEEQADNLIYALEENETNMSQVWAWDVVRVRTVLELGVEIPMISKFSINPEVELFFSKI